MSDEKIALLKSLALRPSRHVAPSVQPMVEAMVEAGCLTFGPAGWMATAHGCALIEQERAKSRRTVQITEIEGGATPPAAPSVLREAN